MKTIIYSKLKRIIAKIDIIKKETTFPASSSWIKQTFKKLKEVLKELGIKTKARSKISAGDAYGVKWFNTKYSIEFLSNPTMDQLQELKKRIVGFDDLLKSNALSSNFSNSNNITTKLKILIHGISKAPISNNASNNTTNVINKQKSFFIKIENLLNKIWNKIMSSIGLIVLGIIFFCLTIYFITVLISELNLQLDFTENHHNVPDWVPDILERPMEYFLDTVYNFKKYFLNIVEGMKTNRFYSAAIPMSLTISVVLLYSGFEKIRS